MSSWDVTSDDSYYREQFVSFSRLEPWYQRCKSLGTSETFPIAVSSRSLLWYRDIVSIVHTYVEIVNTAMIYNALRVHRKCAYIAYYICMW